MVIKKAGIGIFIVVILLAAVGIAANDSGSGETLPDVGNAPQTGQQPQQPSPETNSPPSIINISLQPTPATVPANEHIPDALPEQSNAPITDIPAVPETPPEAAEQQNATTLTEQPVSQPASPEAPASNATNQPVLLPENTTPPQPTEQPATTINQTQEQQTQANITPPVNTTEPVVPTVLKTLMQLIVDKLTVITGELVNIRAILTYENKSPVAHKAVDFTANNAFIGTKTTDEQGTAELVWNTSPFGAGTYAVTARYAGDETTQSSSAAADVVVRDVVNQTLNLTVAVNASNVTAPVVAATRNDYIKLISNTQHCIDNCMTVYQVCRYDADESSFDLDFKDKKGKKNKGLDTAKNIKRELAGEGFNLRDVDFEWKKPVAVEVPRYEACTKSYMRISNETGQEEEVFYETACRVGTTTEWHAGSIWEKFTPGKMKNVGVCFELKVTGKINWGDYVDNVVSFAGYSYDEYAEWNGDVLQHTLTADFAGNGTNVTNAGDKLAAITDGGGATLIDDFDRADQAGLGGGWTLPAGSFNLSGNTAITDIDGTDDKAILSANGARNSFNYTVDFQAGTKSPMVHDACYFYPDAANSAAISDSNVIRIGLNTNTISMGGSNSTSFIFAAGQNYTLDIAYNTTNDGELKLWIYPNTTSQPASPTVTRKVDANDNTFIGFGNNVADYSSVCIWDNFINQSTPTPSTSRAQWTYTSQKVDTGIENETIRINVSTNNASALKYEARVSNTSTSLDSASFFAFSHDTELSQLGRWVQYRLNASHQNAEVYELNITRRLDALGNEQGDEANARAAIENTANSHLSGHTIYTDQQVYLRNASNAQVVGTVDKVVVKDNKRWLFNYLTGTDPLIGLFNITPVVYSLEMQNLTTSQIQQRVGLLINATK